LEISVEVAAADNLNLGVMVVNMVSAAWNPKEAGPRRALPDTDSQSRIDKIGSLPSGALLSWDATTLRGSGARI
jgi:hypothetical protein